MEKITKFMGYHQTHDDQGIYAIQKANNQKIHG